MNLLSSFRNGFLEWWYDGPLPALEANTTPIFQCWHVFDSSINRWIPFDGTQISSCKEQSTGEDPGPTQGFKLVLVTWNVDATSSKPETRISGIISHLQNSVQPVDIIFLQEVSRPALLTLLALPWIRDHWYASDADTTNWGTDIFTNITLVSKSYLGTLDHPGVEVNLGPVWRVNYPSRFRRNALCCDILLHSSKLPDSRSGVPSSASSTSSSRRYPSRIRLINVHLDSLPIQPSLRPRQLSIVASYLHGAGRGLVAGDFNPVLPEDDSLINANSLTDIWADLHPNESGFTWSDENQPFPPNRLDKVAVFGLKAYDIQVIPPGLCTESSIQEGKSQGNGRDLRWSDHSGLLCSFGLE